MWFSQIRSLTLLGTAILLASGSAGIGTLRSVYGQSAIPVWSSPQLLGEGWWQSLAVDRAGTAHVGWYHAPAGHDSLMYTFRPIDGEWSVPYDAVYTGEGGLTVRNALGITSQGMLFAAYRDGTDHWVSGAPAFAAENAQNWNLLAQIGSGYYIGLLVDDRDQLHVVSSSGIAPSADMLASVNFEQLPCPMCSDLIYRRSTDGGMTWSGMRNLTNTPNSGADRVNIWQGASGRIYINWDEGLDWYVGRGAPIDVRFVYSNDGGETWSDPVTLDGGGYRDRRPIQIALTELPDESLMAIWRYASPGERGIYFQISHDLGQTWTEPEPIPGILARDMGETPLDDYELITDLTGVVHFFGTGLSYAGEGDATSLYHIEFRQGQWRSPRRIVQGTDLILPEWPKAAIGPRNEIHLTWFIRNDWYNPNPREPKLQVYYAFRPGTLPEREIPGFVPTSTPQPTVAALPAFNPTPTPFPTLVPVDANVRVSANRDLYAIETLLGALFASATLCVGVFVIHRYLWRR
jgi:hypothetical protein